MNGVALEIGSGDKSRLTLEKWSCGPPQFLTDAELTKPAKLRNFKTRESIPLSVYQLLEEGRSSVGNQEIAGHNYKFGHGEYLCLHYLKDKSVSL